jgi:tRNA (guanine-N7-)-methyltransferase
MTEPDASGMRRVRSYVIRAGRMTEAQKRAFEGHPSAFLLPPGSDLLDFRTLFGKTGKIIVEIGFGMGDATLDIAAADPSSSYLGIEVHRPGIGRLLMEIERRGIGNVRVAEGDALEIFEGRISPGSLAGVHLFFPDPWPKKRHHKRRIVQAGFAALVSSRLLPGSGYFHMATDWEEYAIEALAVFEGEKSMRNAGSGFAPRPEWRPMTKFEGRARDQGRGIFDIHFIKK